MFRSSFLVPADQDRLDGARRPGPGREGGDREALEAGGFESLEHGREGRLAPEERDHEPGDRDAKNVARQALEHDLRGGGRSDPEGQGRDEGRQVPLEIATEIARSDVGPGGRPGRPVARPPLEGGPRRVVDGDADDLHPVARIGEVDAERVDRVGDVEHDPRRPPEPLAPDPVDDRGSIPAEPRQEPLDEPSGRRATAPSDDSGMEDGRWPLEGSAGLLDPFEGAEGLAQVVVPEVGLPRVPPPAGAVAEVEGQVLVADLEEPPGVSGQGEVEGLADPRDPEADVADDEASGQRAVEREAIVPRMGDPDLGVDPWQVVGPLVVAPQRPAVDG